MHFYLLVRMILMKLVGIFLLCITMEPMLLEWITVDFVCEQIKDCMVNSLLVEEEFKSRTVFLQTSNVVNQYF